MEKNSRKIKYWLSIFLIIFVNIFYNIITLFAIIYTMPFARGFSILSTLAGFSPWTLKRNLPRYHKTASWFQARFDLRYSTIITFCDFYNLLRNDAAYHRINWTVVYAKIRCKLSVKVKILLIPFLQFGSKLDNFWKILFILMLSIVILPFKERIVGNFFLLCLLHH